MEERKLTELESGVVVYVDEIYHEKLKSLNGFLYLKYYPENYADIALEGEIGRFLMFRFVTRN